LTRFPKVETREGSGDGNSGDTRSGETDDIVTERVFVSLN
jgi:hypothetical protein